MRQREHEEFKRVWGRFRWLNEAMSKRFTSGNFLLGEHEYDEKSLNEYKVDGHQETAAHYKMFGALTRTVEEWRPANILCRRMNVHNPYHGVQSQNKKEKEKKYVLKTLNPKKKQFSLIVIHSKLNCEYYYYSHSQSNTLIHFFSLSFFILRPLNRILQMEMDPTLNPLLSPVLVFFSSQILIKQNETKTIAH
jgi:hypothetical protein